MHGLEAARDLLTPPAPESPAIIGGERGGTVGARVGLKSAPGGFRAMDRHLVEI
jgi:hypothetical protein